MIWIAEGGKDAKITPYQMKSKIKDMLKNLGSKKKVLAVPPDITRLHSQAGEITKTIWEYYGPRLNAVLPALGTHSPMNDLEKRRMFGEIPLKLYREHDWRDDPVCVGTVPASYINQISEGLVNFDIPMEVSKTLVQGGHDLILSVGQVVPHEVIGMANHNKNIFIGTGGAACINKSHFLGAAFGMERIMGRADTPVRRVMNYGSEKFINNLPIVYILTVIGTDKEGRQILRGLFAGDDNECFERAAALSLEVNFKMLEGSPKKIVVYLDPEEYRSTWLGNKAIYRTRMAIADGGELIIIAPGIKEFGEDPEIDRLIRKYGYTKKNEILEKVKTEDDLKENLGAAAHLIHGSSEGRFKITYAPGHLTKGEVESVGYTYSAPETLLTKYNPSTLKNGWNKEDGEAFYYISNPALGLWACKTRFME